MPLQTPETLKALQAPLKLDTDADEESLDSLVGLTERYCVVYQSLRNPPPIQLTR